MAADTNFEEKSGLVASETSWGNWGQTIEDVLIEIEVKPGTSSKSISCVINAKSLSVTVNEKTIIKVIEVKKIIKVKDKRKRKCSFYN